MPRPIAARLAQTFRESLVNRAKRPHRLAKSVNKRQATGQSGRRSRRLAKRRNRAHTRASMERATSKPSQPAHRVRDMRRAGPQAPPPPLRGMHAASAPGAWTSRDRSARKALAAQTAAGNDPRRSAAVNRVRGEAISEGHRRNRSWAREHPGQRDEAWFKREIAPKLDGFSLNEIAGRQDYRSQPARASGPVRGCRIHGTGSALLALVKAGN